MKSGCGFNGKRSLLGGVSLRDIIILIAFILLGIGTVGLLLNEFLFDLGRSATLTFAVLNLVGFILLSSAQWCMKNKDK